jgi:hypothetical protein
MTPLRNARIAGAADLSGDLLMWSRGPVALQPRYIFGLIGGGELHETPSISHPCRQRYRLVGAVRCTCGTGRETASHRFDSWRYLLSPGLREVFEAFRKEVLALDPCVSEEFMKLYVAYRAAPRRRSWLPQKGSLLQAKRGRIWMRFDTWCASANVATW